MFVQAMAFPKPIDPFGFILFLNTFVQGFTVGPTPNPSERFNNIWFNK
jgi:hypothetical protein